MKAVVVFYSFDGNCTFVAEQIKNQLNADLVQLRLENEKRPRGFAKILWGCSLMFSRKNPPLKPYTFDPAAYDLIIIGAPVWAGAPAAPLRTFVSGTAITGKKLALFVCHAGGKRGSLGKFKSMFAGNEIIGETDFQDPLKNGTEAQQQIADWVKHISA
jgi:flavodoxin